MLGRMWRKRNTPSLLVGLQAGTTPLELSLAVSQNTGHKSTKGPNYTTPGHITRGFPSLVIFMLILNNLRIIHVLG